MKQKATGILLLHLFPLMPSVISALSAESIRKCLNCNSPRLGRCSIDYRQTAWVHQQREARRAATCDEWQRVFMLCFCFTAMLCLCMTVNQRRRRALRTHLSQLGTTWMFCSSREVPTWQISSLSWPQGELQLGVVKHPQTSWQVELS